MEIREWLDNNLLDYTFVTENVFDIKDVGRFCVVRDKAIIFDSLMLLTLEEDELETDCNFYCYKFGNNFFYVESKTHRIRNFDILKYLGKANVEDSMGFPFLGVHGGFDILNGSRNYNDWCKKAKFIGVDTLGICEKNTLAGVLKFQIACKSHGIKPIIGAQYTIKDDLYTYHIKCYVKDERGWDSLLAINKKVNVDNLGFIESKDFLRLTDGLIVVLDPKYMPYDKTFPYVLNIYVGDLFWQLDDVVFENDDNDKQFLLNTAKFLKQKDIPPILITDAYYLDKDDYKAKEILNTISGERDYKSHNQYFKHYDNIMLNLYGLFKEDGDFLHTFNLATNTAIQLANRCEFNVPTGLRLLPEYNLTDEERDSFGTNESLFLHLITEGIQRKVAHKENLDEYLSRVEEEFEVISGNNYIDYFLILWDIITWARKNDILVGIGRGSAGGSLIAYLLDIIEIDPLDFGLLFARFMNKGRAEKSYPDIDTDFEASRREDVKRYMEERYGADRVCSVGTYTNLKLKQSFKDLSRLHGVEFTESNYISQVFDIEEGDWIDIFKTAVNHSRVKGFVIKYTDLIEEVRLILNQPKSRSIHACATIIVPNGKTLYNSIPVRKELKNDEYIIVSEWEGNELDKAGYLKEDILGIKQLDKYRFILDEIKKSTGEVIDIYKLPLDDRNVIKLFQEGLNGDIFHFGSKGLTEYCKLLKPENIHDLIAAISLYRPGAMEVNSHNEYVLRKNGEKEVVFHFMMEEITKETYGLIVYQEQVMKTFQVLADFTLAEADDIRRAMVKKEKNLITRNEELFQERAMAKGCSAEEAATIWHEVEVHAGYSFNKSHAAAYTITGYIGQWLKYYYPLQFWTAALQFDTADPKKSNVNRYITEISLTHKDIKLRPVNINESSDVFTYNKNKNEIYWSLNRVKQVGEKALEAIISERNKNGEFFDLKEFLSRVDKRVVNKAVVINLIMAGAFDDLHNIVNIEDRRNLIKQFQSVQKIKDKDLNPNYNSVNLFYWQIQQKEVSGFGELSYDHILNNFTDFDGADFVDVTELQEKKASKKELITGGVIKLIYEKDTVKAGEYASVVLECNYQDLYVTIWNETYKNLKGDSKFKEGNIMIISGMLYEDKYKGLKGVQSTEKSKIYLIDVVDN